MKYKMVTKKEIEVALKDLARPPNNYEADCFSFTFSVLVFPVLVKKLLAERDVYRELAINYYAYRFSDDVRPQDTWDGKTTTEEEVDDAAAKIIERGKL